MQEAPAPGLEGRAPEQHPTNKPVELARYTITSRHRPELERAIDTVTCVPLPGPDVAAIRHYCEERVPPHAIDQVRIEADVEPRHVTVMECRAPWREDYGPEWTRRGIARFRWTAKHQDWTLYFSDRNQRWHLYDLVESTGDIRRLLDELDRDPTCIFWG